MVMANEHDPYPSIDEPPNSNFQVPGWHWRVFQNMLK